MKTNTDAEKIKAKRKIRTDRSRDKSYEFMGSLIETSFSNHARWFLIPLAHVFIATDRNVGHEAHTSVF